MNVKLAKHIYHKILLQKTNIYFYLKTMRRLRVSLVLSMVTWCTFSQGNENESILLIWLYSQVWESCRRVYQILLPDERLSMATMNSLGSQLYFGWDYWQYGLRFSGFVIGLVSELVLTYETLWTGVEINAEETQLPSFDRLNISDATDVSFHLSLVKNLLLRW